MALSIHDEIKYIVYSLRVTGLQPSWTKFGIFYADVSLLHFIGEIMTVGIMGVFYSAQVSQSVASLFISATTLFSAGFIRCVNDS